MRYTLQDYTALTGMAVQDLSALLKANHIDDSLSADSPVSGETEALLNQYIRFPDALTGAQPAKQKSQQELQTELLLQSCSAMPVSSEMLLKQGFLPFLTKFAEACHQNALLRMIVCASAFISLADEAAYALYSDVPEQKHKFLGKILLLLKQLYLADRLNILPDKEYGEVQTLIEYIYKQSVHQQMTVLSVSPKLNPLLAPILAKHSSGTLIMDVDSSGCLSESRKSLPLFSPPESAKLYFPDKNYPCFPGKIPHLQDTVFTESGRCLRLSEQIGTGGEGTVFAVNATECIKIFHFHTNTPLKLKKLRKLCDCTPVLREKNPLLTSRIALPEQIVCTASGEPVGYLMRRFSGITPLDAFQVYDIHERHPGFMKKHQIAMAVSLAELTDFMHQNHILLCDALSSFNIFFDDQQNAFLLDMDSVEFVSEQVLYQTGAGHAEILSPEHIGQDHGIFLRKSADDVWVLQNQLFYILTFSTPYARKNCSSLANDVRKGLYPFQNGQNDVTDQPANMRFCYAVSHLSFRLREDFWHSFHHDGQHFQEEHRLSAQQWLKHCLNYQMQLPYMIQEDLQSGILFPDHFRKASPKF